MIGYLLPMADLSALVRELAGPLELEARKGYPDTAVIRQSIEEYARAWAERVRPVVGEAQKPHVESVARALEGYSTCARDERRARVEEARRLLAGLNGEVPKGQRRGTAGASRVQNNPQKGRGASGRRHSEGPQKGAETTLKGPSKPRKGAGRAHAERPVDAPPRTQIAQGWLEEGWAEGRAAGAKWAKRMAAMGVETRRDLLYYFPRDYVPVCRVGDLVDGERAAVVVTAGLREEQAVRERRSFRLMRWALEVSDDTGKAWVTSFARVPRRGKRAMAILGSPLALKYEEGTRVLIEGLVKRAGSFIEVECSDSRRLGNDRSIAPGMLAPVYPLTEGVYQGQVRAAVRRLLEDLPAGLPDPLPQFVRAQHALPGLREALLSIHWPASPEAKEAAIRRMALEELLTLQVALAQRKREMQQPGSGLSMKPKGDIVVVLEEILPFSLTRAQQRVIGEIVGDMAADVPMSRMLQGDVGSGKTVVAAAGLMIAIQNGYQGALMAPTELLAEQHYLVLSRLLEALGVRVELVTGSMRGAERAEAYARIAEGEAQVIVGTHALIQEGIEFANLGLVVVDEQHRFGVRQRSELRGKGGRPDMLVMTATPIPRSLALTLYGDLEMSILDEIPPGRAPVCTKWLSLDRQAEAYEFVREQLRDGGRAYVVCPLVEESEKLQAEAATRLAEELRTEVFSEAGVGLLHGAMPVAQKEAVMESFRTGGVQVLCSTTVVEVGVDVPEATVMVVLNAERFGLAQLHQLRGRVGRGERESHCLLLTERKYNPTGRLKPMGEDLSEARGRLKVLLETTDGFRIAEEDLMLRGPGEFYGTRQHGMPDFRLARMARDLGVLEEAREAGIEVIAADPSLERPEHAALRAEVAALRARMDRLAG